MEWPDSKKYEGQFLNYKNLVKGLLLGYFIYIRLMVVNIQGLGKMANNMELVCVWILMDIQEKVFGKMEQEKIGLMNEQIESVFLYVLKFILQYIKKSYISTF